MTFMMFVPLHLFLCLLALSITISGKWLLLGMRYTWKKVHILVCIHSYYLILYVHIYIFITLGRRKQGAYPWDESSYCQRWQVYLTLEEIRRGERRKTGTCMMWWWRCLRRILQWKRVSYKLLLSTCPTYNTQTRPVRHQ
jgi:hypothetical protein